VLDEEVLVRAVATAVATALSTQQAGAKAAPRTPAIDTIQLIADYLDAHKHWSPSYWRATKVYLERWDGKLGRQDIIAHLDRITARRGRTAAGGDQSALSAFCAWLVGRGLLEQNPAMRAALGRCKRLSKPRERVLSLDELAAVWKACTTGTPGGDGYGSIIRLLILTGCRKSEIGSAQWAWVKLDDPNLGPHIRFPGPAVKNRRTHLVPLSPLAVSLLPQKGKDDGSRRSKPFLFGLRKNSGYSGWGKAKQELDDLLASQDHKLDHWVVHDLRRSAVSGWVEHELADVDLAELSVNHISGARGGVAGIYQRSQRWKARRQLMDSWSELIAKGIQPSE
jgi:integrase